MIIDSLNEKIIIFCFEYLMDGTIKRMELSRSFKMTIQVSVDKL
jgi:hypothetical protein